MISQCLMRDQHRFRQRLASLQASKRPDTAEESLTSLERDIQQSIQRRKQREQNRPQVTFAPDLPITQHRQQIADAIAENQVIIVCGETGSGKTTQLPKICLDLGRGVAGLIGHTQPRRIAARSVAARIANELQSPLGQHVGYKVRFNDRLSANTYIKVMTDGILLSETQHDRFLNQYDTLIVDEAHERSLNIDFLLGYIKQLLPRRADLKVIVTSATIDPQRFSRHFNGAPVIEVSGRTYPVEVRYRPVQAEEPDEEDPTLLQAIVGAVDEIAAESRSSPDASSQSDPAEPEDILIFLSGEREIRETTEALQKHHPPGTELLPLYARLSTQEQNRVFEPHSRRRIVLATNVAETSLTVPGIRYVIDPGFARISRYSANARVQRLPIEPISRASADQRKGRCGRIAPGICIRLYSHENYESRPEFTDPEILRANLASVILQMKSLRLGEVERFPFLEPPRPTMIREGYQTLLELAAVDDRHRITRLGHELARLPVDPRFGRMILAAREENSLREVLIIASALATQDPRLRPADAQTQADIAHQQFLDEASDFLSYLKMWDFYHTHAAELSSNKLRKLCQQQYLSYIRMREWQDVHRQLHAIVTEHGLPLNDQPASYESIHRALLAGLLNNVGLRGEGHEYTGPRERKFSIWPGSGLFKKGPKWIMAAELVETTRLYARTVARIHPEWIEKAASHLLKRSHSDPHWNEQSAHVEAYERISLHGLVIVPKRRIHFGPINPTVAREIFIHQALVEGALPHPFCDAPFFVHNRALIHEVRTSEAKSRRRNVMVSEEAMVDFFDRRVPQNIYNGPLFEKWRREAERRNPTLLFLTREDLLRRDAQLADAEQFPDVININGVRLPLSYRFDPGDVNDGVSIRVPLEAINQIQDSAAAWLVPGMLREKIAALLRTLPKSLRRHFVPAPEFADLAAKYLQFGQGDLLDALGAELHRRVGVEIPRSAWKQELLPDHLRMNFEVIDSQGQTVCSGRDLSQLRARLATTSLPSAGERQPLDMERSNLTAWTFGDLPVRIELTHRGFALFGYPALVDDLHSVSIRVINSEFGAVIAHRAGVRRLFVLQVQDELEAHVQYLPELDTLRLLYAPLGDSEELVRDLTDLIADRAFIGDNADIRTQTEFDRRLRSGWNNLWPLASETSDLIGRILQLHQSIDLQLEEARNPIWEPAVADIRQQIAELLPHHVFVKTPYAWLQQYPRYLAAIQTRLRKLLSGGATRDAHATAEIAEFRERCVRQMERNSLNKVHDPALEHFRWMIEEYRVSLFAQELGTLFPISGKRLNAQWGQVRQ